MYNLIRKDILLLVNYFIITIPISIFFIIVFTPKYPDFGYGMSAFAIAYMLTISVPSLDARNHCDVIINSLPVSRTEVIQAKYLSSFIFILISLIMVSLVGRLANLFPLPWQIPYITWPNIVIAFISMALIITFYYPVFYKFYNNAVVVFLNVILFQLVFFMPSYIISFSKHHNSFLWIKQLLLFKSPWALSTLGVGFTVLLLVSYHLTIKIYSNKDF